MCTSYGYHSISVPCPVTSKYKGAAKPHSLSWFNNGTGTCAMRCAFTTALVGARRAVPLHPIIDTIHMINQTMRLTRRLALAGLFLLLPARTATAQAMALPDTVRVTLQSVLERALDVSPDLGEVRADRDFAEARSRLARSSRFLTEFNATTAHAVAPGIDNPNGTPDDELYLDPEVRNDWDEIHPFNQVQVEAIQPVFTWGELGGNIRAARHGVEVEQAAVSRKELEVALRAAELYYNVLLTNELLRLAERTRNVVEQAEQEFNRLLEEDSPDVDNADVFQLQLTKQEFNSGVVEVTENSVTARVALARQMILPEGAVVVPANDVLTPLPFVPETLDRYLDLAMDNRPELAQGRAGLAARDALVKVARSDYFPKLFVGAMVDYAYAAGRVRQPNAYIGDSFLSSSVRAGFGFRQKLNFFQTRARVDQARAEREQVRYQLEGAEQLILFEVEKAFRDLVVAQTALAAQDTSLTITKEWLRAEYIDFDLDLGDTENLVKAVRANIDVEARYYQAVHRYNLAVLRLLDAIGILARGVQSGTLVE